MSLKIGSAIKAGIEGKWIKVPAVSGAFHLKLKQMLIGEQYAFSKKKKALENDDPKKLALTIETIAAHTLDWKGLLEADESEIAFNPELFKDKTFTDSLFALTVEDGRYLMEWIVSTINKSDVFAEDDESFLANT